jgi:formylglycine-generating enzyme required for sulfatase activity
LLCATPAQAAERVALVIGNNTYRHGTPLSNCVNDAQAVAGALKAAGFEVTVVENAGLEQMEAKTLEFRHAAQGAKAAWFHYSGHGAEVKGVNYLIPVDAEVKEEFQVKHKAFALDQMLGAMEEAGTPLKVVVLDCCRDNPFGRGWSRNGAAGLAQVAGTPAGTIIAFATSPGKVAADGVGQNSPFTVALVAALNKPGLDVKDVFNETGRAVLAATQSQQQPWVNSSFFDSFVLRPGGASVVPVRVPEDVRPRWREGFQAGERLLVEVAPGVEMAFRWCPAGSFTMGSPAGEKEVLRRAGVKETFYNNETPHPVKLTQGFWLAETEVTQGQWRAVMGTSLVAQANKALADDEEYGPDGKKQTLRDYYKVKAGDGAKIIGVESEWIAMYWVSWHDAADFCRKVSPAVAGKGWGLVMRLPTEAQWEYACRAGSATMSYAGDFAIKGENNAPGLDGTAWYGGNSSRGYEGKGWNTAGLKEKQYPGGAAGPRRVGQKQPNAWGLCDMLGNVWEWCGDWYGAYPSGAVTDPPGPTTGVSRSTVAARGSAAPTAAQPPPAAPAAASGIGRAGAITTWASVPP